MACGAYALYAKQHGFTFVPPRYRRVEKLPFIPLDSEVKQLIGAMGLRYSAFLSLNRYHSEAHPIYYTDSFFYDYPVSETIATLEPYPTLPFRILSTVPITVDVKGTSRAEGAVIFRGKMYYQSPDNQAASGWKPNPRFFGEIVEGKLRTAGVERQVIRKWKTRDRSVTVLKVGRWHIKKERYDLDTIKRLFRADDKRHRANYDSYQLFLDGERQGSRAWTLDEAYGQMIDDRLLRRPVEAAVRK